MRKKFVPDIPAPGEQKWDFHLGDSVEDPLNPMLHGVLVARTYHISGCDTFSIDLLTDPKDNAVLNKRLQTGWPGNRIKLIEAIPSRHVDEIPPTGVGVAALGDKVRDYITGLEGRVTHLTVFLSQQSVTATIQPAAKNGDVPESVDVDLHLLEVLEAYKQPEKKPATTRAGATHFKGRSGRVIA